MSANEAEIAYLEGQLENLELCTTFDELTEIQQELVRVGLLRDANKGEEAAEDPGVQAHHFLSDEESTSLSAKTTCRTTC